MVNELRRSVDFIPDNLRPPPYDVIRTWKVFRIENYGAPATLFSINIIQII